MPAKNLEQTADPNRYVDDGKEWPKAPVDEFVVPLKSVWAVWLVDRARRNNHTPVEEIQKLVAEAWREDPHRLAQGGSQPHKPKQ